jgi:hypothetical protein
MSVFGRGPVDVWNSALTEIPALAAEAAQGAGDLPPAVLSFRPPADWPVDGGFHGVAALLTQAAEMLAEAIVAWPDGGPGAVREVYEYMRESPYHLVAGSYLAAIGRVAAAALLVRATTAA